MDKRELEVKIKIGEIEFFAKGQADDVEAQRLLFLNNILPAAVDAIRNSRVSQTYIPEKPQRLVADSNEIAISNCQVDLCSTSVNELLKGKGFKTQEEIALGLIYYYEVCKDTPDFSTDDLKKYYRESKNTIPRNPSMVVKRLFSKGHIMEGNGNKRYCLTQSGKKFVEEYVQKDVKVTKTSKPRKKQSKVESPYLQYSADDFNLKKYPELSSLKVFKDQMMLVLYIVKTEGYGDEFSINDIQAILTDIFGFHATTKQIDGVIRRNKTWFKSERDTSQKCFKHRLLNGAIEYAKHLIESKSNGGVGKE